MPPATHVLYIPGVLLVGFVLGFFAGTKSAKAFIKRREAERRN